MIAELDALIETAEDYLIPSNGELPPPVAPLMGVAPAVVIALAQVAKATQAWADEEYSGWSITPTAVAMDAALTALASALAPGGDKP